MGCVGTRAQALGVSQRLHVLDHSGSTSSSPAGWFHQLWQLPGGQLSVVPWGVGRASVRRSNQNLPVAS